ncbi:ankyrin repeat-containing protein [Zymoseptoria brevis]|uniref:Ankyrin repeat-containing protein n=1 Tax=Zymoseptoria brevis TaxID=1047168 RepID=A0A0F4GCK3_9PEZI|nr:ankyrin repeat-containing protein [Zymoseptoria brevis]
MAQAPSIDRLLNLVPESPDTVLSYLQTHPDLALKQDAHGYSLVHAAASYGHTDLLRALVKEYNVDPNIKDEDGETALFSVEDVAMAKELIELGTDVNLRNDEGQLATEKLDDPDEQPAVAAYLREAAGGGSTAPADASESLSNGDSAGNNPPPPLPQGLQLNVGTMRAGDAGEEPDPEFRRRIEELAARGDFDGEEGQRELRNLVMDAISGVTNDAQAPAATRRRLD